MLSRTILFLFIISLFNLNNASILGEENDSTHHSEEIIETGEEVENEEDNWDSSKNPENKKISPRSRDKNNDVFEHIQNNENQVTSQNYNQAKIIALNKITAKSEELIIKKGEAKFFGNIEIKMHKCIKQVDPYFMENKILLTISENKIDEDPNILFQGWMFSSSISVSTFEHPVYEIFAKDCL